jgi:hypothetical protein
MTDEDDKLTRRYRELAREEPPSAIDAAILAASRRAVKARPWSQRWIGPVSIAAVLVLGIGVSLNMQRERPGIEVAAPQTDSSATRSALPQTPPAQSPAKPQVRDEIAGAPGRNEVASAPGHDQVASAAEAATTKKEALEREAKSALKKEAAPAPAPPAELRAPSKPFADARATREAGDAAPRAKAQAEPSANAPQAQAGAAANATQARAERAANAARIQADPAAELERIAVLRAAGRHAEADKALEEFRRRFPDYRIPDPIWDRVRAR